MDIGAGYLGPYSTIARGSADCRASSEHFSGGATVKDMYCDGAKELRKAKHDLFAPGDYSVPGRPGTNGIVEGRVKKLSRR
eukprot:606623-Alexandrium_andersonii.AAC.1